MKYKTSIVSVSLAMILLIVFSVWPHHHHNESLCMVMEICHEDHALNDCHTHHHDAEEHNEQSCRVHSNLISLNSTHEQEILFKSSTDVLPHLIAWLSPCPDLTEGVLTAFRHFCPRSIPLRFYYLASGNGLRAPPHFIA
ncbi:MAG: hypothetical protein SPK32_08930 [Bacteroidaceae bacterium]|nr:hypothetical protein [Bacteroidaceae bacterium]